jgi:hypothetical protein
MNQQNAGNGKINSFQALLALAELNLNKNIIAVLLEMSGFKKEHIQFLCGPIIQHHSPWMSSTPEWMYQAIIPERLRIIIDEHEQGIIGSKVGPVEIATVMYPATCDAPLRHECCSIYLWASAQANAKNTGKSVSEIWEMLGGEVVRDDQVIESRGTYNYEYAALVSDIRHRVVRAEIERMRKSRKPTKTKTSNAESQTEIIGQQLALFG